MTDFGSSQEPTPLTISLVAIQEAKNTINDSRLAEFTAWLKLMPLDKLSKDSGDKLLAIFLFQIWRYNRPKFIKPLFVGWEKIYPREEPIPFYVILFTISLLPSQILRFVISNLEGVTFLEIIESLMTFHYQEISTACQKTWEAFGSQSYHVLLTLQEMAKKEENPAIYNFLTDKIREKSPYAMIPSWVRDFRQDVTGAAIYQPDAMSYGEPRTGGSKGPILPTYSETIVIPDKPVVKLPPTNQIANLMLEGLKQGGSGSKEIDQVKSKLISELTISTEDEKMKMVKPFLLIKAGRARQNDSLLHRLYGPANPNINPTVSEMKYGGERMFTSLTIIDDPDMEDVIVDWFVGYCQQCDLRIRRRWHAVRVPGESGGWMGCYCSWKCVRESLITPDSFDGESNPSLVKMGLIDQIQKQIIRLGVQDRRDNGDILPGEETSDFGQSFNPILTAMIKKTIYPGDIQTG